ncbi:MAG: response regulator [Zoogloea sp.]|uniref:response regulator n=1 Tax=Zoogloea sp. TaxID=49181 RepID=UPI003F2EF679|nr:response regulator [Rhodocyclales bacterium]
MSKVLLVDDDVELVSMLREYIEQEGFSADCVHDGEAGVNAALSGAYAIVVLDVMMPRVGGIEALRRIRAQSEIPVLMLTARGDDVDRIVGLELGADDYVPKPCTPRELVARIRAILRRTQDAPAPQVAAHEPVVAGPLQMWPQRRRAEWYGNVLDLTSTEFNLLELLARSAGRVVNKGDLSEQGLGRPLARFDRSIDVHLSSIRHKLGSREDGRPWIETVRGQGYQLVRE